MTVRLDCSECDAAQSCDLRKRIEAANEKAGQRLRIQRCRYVPGGRAPQGAPSTPHQDGVETASRIFIRG